MVDVSGSVSNRLVVLTGADSGLALSMADKLVQAGARVALVVRAESEPKLLEEVSHRKWGGAVDIFPIDRALYEIAPALISRIASRMGYPDGLINNVGVRTRARLFEITSDDWDYILDTNMKTAFFMCQAFAASVCERGGKGAIVNVASHLGIVAAKDYSLYSVSKAGLIAITRALSIELARRNIAVNAVAPGPTNTARAGLLGEELEVMDFLNRMPIARRVEPDDVANAVVYLLGTAGGSVTGHTLVVDGGWTVW